MCEYSIVDWHAFELTDAFDPVQQAVSDAPSDPLIPYPWQLAKDQFIIEGLIPIAHRSWEPALSVFF